MKLSNDNTDSWGSIIDEDDTPMKKRKFEVSDLDDMLSLDELEDNGDVDLGDEDDDNGSPSGWDPLRPNARAVKKGADFASVQIGKVVGAVACSTSNVKLDPEDVIILQQALAALDRLKKTCDKVLVPKKYGL